MSETGFMCEAAVFNCAECPVQCQRCRDFGRKKSPMPAKKKHEQHFLVTVQQMTTCDEADMVSGWSAVVSESDLKNFGALAEVPVLTRGAIEGAPGTNLRPMTLKEIKAWRKDPLNV